MEGRGGGTCPEATRPPKKVIPSKYPFSNWETTLFFSSSLFVSSSWSSPPGRGGGKGEMRRGKEGIGGKGSLRERERERRKEKERDTHSDSERNFSIQGLRRGGKRRIGMSTRGGKEVRRGLTASTQIFTDISSVSNSPARV